MSFVNYEHVEILLYNYETLCTWLEILRIDLRAVSDKRVLGDDDDIITAETFKGRSYSHIPLRTAGNISDPTGDIAVKYKKTAGKQAKQLEEEIKKDIFLVVDTIEKINVSMRCLSSLQRDIVKKYYFARCTWSDISSLYNIAERTAQAERRKAIRKIVKIIRIPVELYEEILSKTGISKT